VRAILDEQLSPQIAVLLRQAGYDVDAVADREDLAGRSDRIIFEVACSEGRAVVTNNIKDFRPLAAEWLAQGRPDSAPLSADTHPQRHCCCRCRDRECTPRPPGRARRE